MTTTYEPIATTTLGSDQANVTFSSILGSYTDLLLIGKIGFSVNGQDLLAQVNDDTGNNYSGTNMRGNGSATGTSRWTNTSFFYLDYNGITNAVQNVYLIHFMNYSNTTTFKTVFSKVFDISRGAEANINTWRSTSAINKITLYGTSGNLLSGSTFTLYGIKAE